MKKVRCYEPRQTQFWHSSVWKKSDAMYPGRLGLGTALLGKKSDVNCYEPRKIWFWHSSVWRKSDVMNTGRHGSGIAL